MSVQAMGWVIEHSPHSGGALLCLLMIAWHADRDGTDSWPSVATLAAECRLNERHVRRLIDHLEATGAIAVERGRGRGRHHRMTVRMGAAAAENRTSATENRTPVSSFDAQNRTRGAGFSEQNRTSATEKPDIAPEKPQMEPSLTVLTPSYGAELDGLDAALEPVRERGYGGDRRFLAVLARAYPQLDLELEALKLTEWLQEPRNAKRRCSKKFIDNWMRKAEADRVAREQAALARPALPMFANGNGGGGGVQYPAAFQRNLNPEADIPERLKHRTAAQEAADEAAKRAARERVEAAKRAARIGGGA